MSNPEMHWLQYNIEDAMMMMTEDLIPCLEIPVQNTTASRYPNCLDTKTRHLVICYPNKIYRN